jgi:hypothetical protein
LSRRISSCSGSRPSTTYRHKRLEDPSVASAPLLAPPLSPCNVVAPAGHSLSPVDVSYLNFCSPFALLFNPPAQMLVEQAAAKERAIKEAMTAFEQRVGQGLSKLAEADREAQARAARLVEEVARKGESLAEAGLARRDREAEAAARTQLMEQMLMTNPQYLERLRKAADPREEAGKILEEIRERTAAAGRGRGGEGDPPPEAPPRESAEGKGP